MLKISYTACLDLSPGISAQFTLTMCVAARNREKFTKTSDVGVSRSFKVIVVYNFRTLVTSACYDKQHGQYSSATVSTSYEPIDGKITTFEEYPYFTPSFKGNLLTQGHEIVTKKLESLW